MKTTITRYQLEDLSDYLRDNATFEVPEGEDFDAFQSYSGRYMYGRDCIGIVVNRSNQFELAMLMGEWLIDAKIDRMHPLARVFRSPFTDDMGLDIIVYWPDLTVEEQR